MQTIFAVTEGTEGAISRRHVRTLSWQGGAMVAVLTRDRRPARACAERSAFTGRKAFRQGSRPSSSLAERFLSPTPMVRHVQGPSAIIMTRTGSGEGAMKAGALRLIPAVEANPSGKKNPPVPVGSHISCATHGGLSNFTNAMRRSSHHSRNIFGINAGTRRAGTKSFQLFQTASIVVGNQVIVQ